MAESEVFKTRRNDFIQAVLEEIKNLGHTVERKPNYTGPLEIDDGVVLGGGGLYLGERMLIDGAEPGTLRITYVMEGGHFRKFATDKLEVSVQSVYAGRVTVRGMTWVEKKNPVSPSKVATKLIGQALAMKAYNARQVVLQDATQTLMSQVEKLQADFNLPEFVHFGVDFKSIRLSIDTTDMEVLRKVCAALTK